MIVGVLALVCSGCVQKDFPPEKAQGIIANHPIHLDAEQVMLSSGLVDCGIANDLWDPPTVMGERSVAHLTEHGRALKFDDDVILAEPGNRQPYAQIRGEFQMALADGPNIRDDGKQAKLVDGRLYVVIPHSCFPDPLPLMGVRRGKFSQEAMPTVRFRMEEDGWHYDRVMH